MSLLYGRHIEVVVAGLTITDLRITVELDRHIDRTQDRGRVSIYNLSPEHEGRIYGRGRGQPITVTAGYPQTLAVIFDGEVQRVTLGRESLASITNINIGDLVRQRNRLGGAFNGSYAGPEPTRRIATDIIESLGLIVGPLDNIPEGATFDNFYWTGPADSALDALLRPVKCTWFEADGVIRINRVGMVQPDAPTIMLSPEDGLIDSPIRTDEGAEVRMFLNPAVVMGAVIDLTSDNLSGRWKVVSTRITADNWSSGRFETFCDLREISS